MMKNKLICFLAASAIILSTVLPVIPAQTVRAEETDAAASEEISGGTELYLVPENATGSAVDAADSGKLQLWSRDDGRRQSFIVSEQGDDYYFTEAMSGKVIEVPNGNTANGTQLQLADFDGSDKQLWTLDKAGDSSYYIHSKINSEYVMDNYRATSSNGALIAVNVLKNGSNQRFSFISKEEAQTQEQGFAGYGEDESYGIIPLCAGSCSVDMGWSNSNISSYKTHRNKNQSWKLRKKGDYYAFVSDHNGQAVQVQNNKAEDNAELKGAAYTGEDKQLFRLDPAGDGTYYIRSKLNENYVWDVWGASESNDTKIMLYKAHYHSNQRFRFVHLSTVEEMSAWGASRSDCYAADYDIWDGANDTDWYYADKNARTYELDSARDLAGLSKLVREGTCDFEGKTIILTRDINLAGVEWRRIGLSGNPFKGSFNGGGHAITGLSITTTDSQDGFFGEVNGGSITNFAIKGSVSGDWNTGGVVGNMSKGHIVNVYSEVSLTRATDDNEGGICGRLGYGAYAEHCTQNARVNSGDADPDRGGIAGYQCGVIRYCVNMQSIDCNWDCLGGISGACKDGKIEYCANYGQVSGGGDTQWAGGICGKTTEDAVVFGCYNSGYVFSNDDDDIGGIVGERCDSSKVYCCINTGTVKGDDRIGGIVGYGNCMYCFNAGAVTGDDDVGAVSGKTGARMEWCRALSWTSDRLHGAGDNNGAEWISADDIIKGKLCWDLNRQDGKLQLGGYGPEYSEVFYQNLGGDSLPSFTGQKVTQDGNGYTNGNYEVRAEYKKGYGTVAGAGSYKSGAVTLTATPADGCEFDHFEVSHTKVNFKTLRGTLRKYPSEEVETYKEDKITLTQNIDTSYRVKAVFKVYDEVPEDLRQKVKIELECVDDADGWNGSTIPVYLIDSAEERHLWEVSRSDLDDDDETVSHTFDLGAASPVSLEAWPDFGGGITFRSYGLKARMWVNDAGSAIESSKVTIRSYPFISSKYGNDYMNITFENRGNSSVGVLDGDGNLDVKGTYTKCTEAWDAAQKLGEKAVIRLDSVWLLSDRLYLNGNKTVTIDLNGFPMIRSIKKTKKNGEVIEIMSGSTLNVIDSNASRKSCSSFKGGSIQGGRSTNGGGVFHVRGTLNMTGGAIYNGGTTDCGGGIQCKGGNVNLKNTLIAGCWSNKARIYDNNGGAVAVRDGGKVRMEGCTIRACRANEKGGAIHMNSDNAEVTLIDTVIKGCRATDDEGGAIYQDDGDLYCENTTFDCNLTDDRGGAVYINTDNPSSFVNCLFKGNQCENDDGGAIYLDDDNLYMCGCTLTGNACSDEGGAIYLSKNSSIDLAGKMVIRNNDGTGTWDNLVLGKNAYLYDAGLEPGSEVHLRSTSNGETEMSESGYEISEYQMKNYLVSDYSGGLKLTDTKNLSTKLEASAFSSGKAAVIIGGILIILAGAGAGIMISRKRKGEQS